MRIKIKVSSFILVVQSGFLLLKEFSNNGCQWIKFPPNVLTWVCDSLNICSKISTFSYKKRAGFVAWKVESHCRNGMWVLEFCILMRGVKYSVYVPAESPSSPWQRFIDLFIVVARSMLGSGHLMQTCSPEPDFSSMSSVSEGGCSSHKVIVDELLAQEIFHFSFQNEAMVVEHSSQRLMVDELLEFESSPPLIAAPQCYSLAFEASSCSSNNGIVSPNSIFDMGSINVSSTIMGAEVVDSFPGFKSSKKKNSTRFVIVPFASESYPGGVISENEASPKDSLLLCSAKLPMSRRSSSRRRSPPKCFSSWEKMSQGVKEHKISRYSEYPSLGVHREWMVEALGLSIDATEEEIFKRMYEFHKSRRINISKKVIRILEGVSKDQQTRCPVVGGC